MQAERFRRAIVLLALTYCLIETVYVLRLPLVMDEFDGAYESYRLRHQIPYRDYVPYKTVIGYYVEAVPALFRTDVWNRIVAMKLELVVINTAMLIAAAFYARRFASPAAIALLIICSTFLERSAELRVDMLTAWAGLWSLLFLLSNRYALAGAVAGFSFLLSQKGAFYLVAGTNRSFDLTIFALI